MPSDIANLLLADSLAAFMAAPGGDAGTGPVARRVDLLGEGFDLALRMGDLPDDALLVATKLTVFSHGLYASPDYLANHGDPQTPRRPAAPHGSPAGQRARGRPALDAQRWSARLARPATGADGGQLARNSGVRLACSGMGLAGVPDLIACGEVKAGRLRRVLPTWSFPPTVAWAVTPGRRLLPAKTRAFIEMLQRSLQQAQVDA
jgi:DNA-binding transcriptional LysR family regulator